MLSLKVGPRARNRTTWQRIDHEHEYYFIEHDYEKQGNLVFVATNRLRHAGSLPHFWTLQRPSKIALPRPSNRVDSELIGMARPVRSSLELPATAAASRTLTELMVNRGHRVLRNAPRVVLLHGDCWRNDQSCWLACAEIVIISMPRLLHGLIPRPVISPGRMGCPVDCVASRKPATGPCISARPERESFRGKNGCDCTNKSENDTAK